MAGEITLSIALRLRSTATTLNKQVPTVRQSIDQTTALTASGVIELSTVNLPIDFGQVVHPGILYIHNIDPSTTFIPRIDYGTLKGTTFTLVASLRPREATVMRLHSSNLASTSLGFRSTNGATPKLEYELWAN